MRRPNKLKLVAEALGLNPIFSCLPGPQKVVIKTGYFDPAENLSQRDECEEWLLDKSLFLVKYGKTYGWLKDPCEAPVSSGQSRAQAAIDAIVEVIKHD